MKKYEASIIGLGKLGAAMLACFAKKKIKKHFNKNIKIFTNINEAINNNDIIVLCHNDKRLNQVNFKNKIVIDLGSQLKIKKNKNLFFL